MVQYQHRSFFYISRLLGALPDGWMECFPVFIDMHKYSLEISTLRDFLEYPELFKFEDGESLEMNLSEDYQIQLKNISFRYSPNGKDILKKYLLNNKTGRKTCHCRFEWSWEDNACQADLWIL